MSMAVKSSDLGDRTSGANLQMEGYVAMPSQSTEDQWELEALVVLPPTCHPGPQPGGCLQAALILDIPLRYM